MPDGFWVAPPEVTLIVKVKEWSDKILEGLKQIFQVLQAKAEQLARSGAPWADRTGAARQGLRAFVEAGGDSATLYLVHSVFYGIFLELGTRYMGPRPIIVPTLETLYGEVMSMVRALVGG